MKKIIVGMGILMFLATGAALAQEVERGPADALWEIYQEGRFEEVITQGKALLAAEDETAQVNLAVGRSLVHLEKYEEAFPYLNRAAEIDPLKTWVYAWAQVYLGIVHYENGDETMARQAWILARDCNATRNATRNAVGNLNLLGLSEFFDNWKPFATEHFSFRFSDRLVDLDRVEFARLHEDAYQIISKWFGGGPEKKIRFLVWTDQAEADEAGMPPLGFSRPEEFLVHALVSQTLGHEMTHVISHHALQPTKVVGLINEGISVHLDQTGRDQMKRAQDTWNNTTPRPLKVSIPALWLDWSLAPDVLSYPVAGAFVAMLIDKGGKDRFLEFFVDQSYGHAQEIYGDKLAGWINEFEAELYQ